MHPSQWPFLPQASIIGGGKYELKEQYKSLDVSKQWWTMTEEQRKLHLKKYPQLWYQSWEGKGKDASDP